MLSSADLIPHFWCLLLDLTSIIFDIAESSAHDSDVDIELSDQDMFPSLNSNLLTFETAIVVYDSSVQLVKSNVTPSLEIRL